MEKVRKFSLPKAHPISWCMLLITTLAILLTSVSRQILPTVIPAIMQEYHFDAVQAGWLNSFMFIGAFVGSVFFGILSDCIGTGYKRSWSWVYAIGVAVIGGIITAYTRTVGSMRACLAFMGMGTGGSEPVNVAIVGEWWQKENRGFAIGVHHTGFPLGQFVGPLIIGAILSVGTWHEAFIFVPLIGVPIMIAQVILGNKKNQDKVYGWIREHHLTVPVEEGKPATKSSFSDAFRYVGTCFKNRNCLLSIAMIFLFLWAEQGIGTFLTLHLTKIGIGLAAASIISGASGLTGWIGQIFWSSLSDYTGRKVSLKIITAGWIVATLACIFIDSEMTGWVILIGWGLFRNSPYPVVYALLIDSMPKAAASSMGLMIGIAMGLSGFLVAPVAGWIIQTYGFTVHYLILAAVLVVAFIPMVLIKETVVPTK
jgi:MFS family permease